MKLDDALLHGEKAKDAAPFVRVEDDGDDWEAGDKEGGAKNDDNEGSKASTKAGSAKGGAKTSKTSKTSKVEVDITGGVGVTEDGTLVLPDEVDLDAALLLDDAREAFHVFDVDGSGTIDHAEFAKLVDVLGIKLKPAAYGGDGVADALATIDVDGEACAAEMG